jgi:predicted PurR-regulated permease PerM
MDSESEWSALGGLVTRPTLLWWAAALLAAWLLVFVAHRYVGTFALGLFIYYSTRPVNDLIERRIGGARRSALVSLLAVVLPFAVILALVGLAVVEAAADLSGLAAGPAVRYVEPYIDQVSALRTPEEAAAYAETVLDDTTVQGGIATVQRMARMAGNAVFHGFLIVAFVYFLLRDDHGVAAWFTDEVADADSALGRYLRAVDSDLQSVYYGQMLTIFAVIAISIVLYVGLNFLAPRGMRIPQPLLFAALTGVATFIPLVGRGVVYTTIGAYLSYVAVTTDPRLLWYPFVFLVVTFWGLDNLVRYGVRPRLAGRDVPASLLLFTYLLGAGIWGWYGIFLAPLLFVLLWEFLLQVFPALVHGESPDADAADDPVDDAPAEPVESRGEPPGTRDDDAGPSPEGG